MRFWDASAIVQLLVQQVSTRRMTELYREDGEIVAWWGTRVECDSAVARLERADKLRTAEASTALRRLDGLAENWMEIQPVDALREHARRLLRAHNLRAADSLQLAAAFIASEQKPASLDLVCLDDRLRLAAEREGFLVLSG